MNHGCAIMKNNLRTIFDESMGGKPRKQPAISRPVKTSLRPLFLVLFLLTVLSGLAVCVWLAWTYDAQDIYYAWLILVVYSITGTTLFMTIWYRTQLLQKTVFFFNSDPGNVLSFNGKRHSVCVKQTTFGCFYFNFHWWKNHASCRIFLWWNGWLPRWLPPEIFSGKAWNQGKGDIFIGTHLIPPVYQCRVRCEWLVWPVHRWTFAKQSHIS